jgi:DNA-binding transcriptional ArsR family regulator
MMDVDQPIAQIAAAMAEPARARILCALMDGRAYTATELAVVADTASSTASAHLSKLTELGLLTKVSQGRHRYFQLADPAVAQVLESMMHLAGVMNRAIPVSTPQPLRFARSCYDHLAGTVAVALLQRWLQLGWLTPVKSEASEQQPDYQLTALGQAGLAAIGLDYQAKAHSRRRYACGCLDWSERTAHLGGQLGALLLDFMLQKQWFNRQLASRELQLTALGRRQLQQQFQLIIAET